MKRLLTLYKEHLTADGNRCCRILDELDNYSAAQLKAFLDKYGQEWMANKQVVRELDETDTDFYRSVVSAMFVQGRAATA
jgi:hypothetical protein